jgi:hypothetical protein
MNRYVVSLLFFAVIGSPAMGQVPISGAFPPWSPPSPSGPPAPPQAPITYKITDQVISSFRRNIVPEAVITKLSTLKDTTFSQMDFDSKLSQTLTREEIKDWKSVILTYAQMPNPALVSIPAGAPLVGYYKEGGVLVGADGRYPFDSGEWTLAGFAGNTRSYGSFMITLPSPADLDPRNSPIPYRSFRGLFHKGACCQP